MTQWRSQDLDDLELSDHYRQTRVCNTYMDMVRHRGRCREIAIDRQISISLRLRDHADAGESLIAKLYVCCELSTVCASQYPEKSVYKVLGLFGVPGALQSF